MDMKMAAREEAEQRRLLYVGMTRARDLLVLSGGQTTKPGHDTVLSLLGEAMSDEESSIDVRPDLHRNKSPHSCDHAGHGGSETTPECAFNDGRSCSCPWPYSHSSSRKAS